MSKQKSAGSSPKFTGSAIDAGAGTCAAGPDYHPKFRGPLPPRLPEDSWRDRSSFRCGSCMYYVPKDDVALGRCRRHAPTLHGGQGWPVVFGLDWCGDHKLGGRGVPPSSGVGLDL